MNSNEWEAFWRDAKAEELIYYAQRHDPRPLAEHLEAGGEICAKLRAYLAGRLRGTTQPERTGVAVKADRVSKAEAANQVWLIARFDNGGKAMTLTSAQKIFLERNHTWSMGRLKKACWEYGVTKKSISNQ